MTFIVFVVFIVLAARIVYLESRRRTDARLIAKQRGWIVNYYYTLRMKDLPTDFEIWRLELEEPDEPQTRK